MRKLLLLAVAAVAAMAFMAPAASAQVEAESVSEGVMCDNTTAGYCDVVAAGPLEQISIHTFFGTVNYVCAVTMAFHVSSDGSAITEAAFILNTAPGTGNCDDLETCETPWTGQFGEPAAGIEDLTVHLCITGLVTCEGDLHSGALSDTGSGYSAEIVDAEIEGDPTCEFTMDLAMDDIELHH